MDTLIRAPIFNIQPFSLHDGPGIRVTVFLKGCPLRCLWCANPESHRSAPELMEYPSRCTGCGSCIRVCPREAISLSEGRARTDRDLCQSCGACTRHCPREAREIAGQWMTAREVLDRVLEDRLFLEESGGGITLSGGECLLHPEFSETLLRLAKEAGLSTAVESSCYAPQEVIDRIFPLVDHALLDIKHMDPELHRKYTGVDNALILANIRHIHRMTGSRVTIRVPVIPGCNDSPENMEALGRFVTEALSTDTPVHLLPYHRLGESKNEGLGKEIPFTAQPPTDSTMQTLRRILEQQGLSAQIGGGM